MGVLHEPLEAIGRHIQAGEDMGVFPVDGGGVDLAGLGRNLFHRFHRFHRHLLRRAAAQQQPRQADGGRQHKYATQGHIPALSRQVLPEPGGGGDVREIHHGVRGHGLGGHRFRGHRLRGHRLRGHRLRGHRLRGHRLRGHRLRGHRRIQGAVELIHGLEPAPGGQVQAPQNSRLLLGGDRYAQLAGQQQVGIPPDPVQGLGRLFPHQAEIDGGAQGIYVRPGALALLLILLDGGVAVLEGDGQGLVPVLAFPGAAKVDEPHLPVFQHQVIRGDVPVDQAPLVEGGQGPEQGLDHGEQLLGGKPPAPLGNQLGEGGALDVFHDDIGGIVGLKEIPHADDDLLLIHFGHGPGFVEELLLAPLKAFPGGAYAIAHQLRGDGGIAAGLIHGIVFLDGHLELQPQIAADVGNAKPAFPQHPAHHVTIHQHSAGPQVVGGRDIGPCGQAAAGAASFLCNGRHTIGTVILPIGFHDGSLTCGRLQ